MQQKMELGLCSREFWPGEELTSLGKESQMGIHWEVGRGCQGEKKGPASEKGVSHGQQQLGVWGVVLTGQKKAKKGKQH